MTKSLTLKQDDVTIKLYYYYVLYSPIYGNAESRKSSYLVLSVRSSAATITPDYHSIPLLHNSQKD
jgi:hypothetical protein